MNLLKNLLAFLIGFFSLVFFVWLSGVDIFPLHRSVGCACGLLFSICCGVITVCAWNLLRL